MKAKLLTISAAVMALLAVSCQREETGFGLPAGEEVTVTLSASVPTGGPAVKSDTEPGNGDQINRCILGVYMVTDESSTELYGTLEYEGVGTDGTATFEDVTLLTGYDYKLVFWADNVASTTNLQTDNHYVTTDFPTVTYNTADGHQYMSSDDTRDAFYGVFDLTDFSGEVADSYTLTRPFGQLNIFTTDYDDIKMEALKPAKVQMAFTSIPTGMDLINGSLTEPAEGAGGVTGEISAIPDDVTSPVVTGAQQLSFDYIFAPKGQQRMISGITMRFYDEDDNELGITPYSFPELPVQANYRTNVSGALLTKSADLKIDISEDFDGTLEKDVYTVSTLADAEQILNDIASSASPQPEIISITVENQISSTEGENSIELPGITTEVELNLTQGIASGATFTIQDVKAGTSSSQTEGSDFTGRLVLSNQSTEPQGTLVINLPEGSAEITGGNYSNVQVTTADDTFVLGSDTEVENLTIQKGTVKLYGSVTGTFTKAEGYTVYRCLSDQQSMDNLIADDKSGYSSILVEVPTEQLDGKGAEFAKPVVISADADIRNCDVLLDGTIKSQAVLINDGAELVNLLGMTMKTANEYSTVKFAATNSTLSVEDCDFIISKGVSNQSGLNVNNGGTGNVLNVILDGCYIGFYSKEERLNQDSASDYEYSSEMETDFKSAPYSRGITLAKDNDDVYDGTAVTNVEIRNTYIEGAYYAINTLQNIQLNVDIENSVLDGRAALNIWTTSDAISTINVKSSKFIGRNTFSGPTEEFATIVFNNQNSNDGGRWVKNTVVTLDDTEVCSYNNPQTETNRQYSVDMRSKERNKLVLANGTRLRELYAPRLDYLVELDYWINEVEYDGTITVEGVEGASILKSNVWDGNEPSSKRVPSQCGDGKYYIGTPADLYCAMYFKKTGDYVLARDIDLGNHPWKVVDNNDDGDFESFAFNFDGAGHTIYNLKSETYLEEGEGAEGLAWDNKSQNAGLFGVFNGELKNLTVDGAEIYGSRSGVLVGRLDGGSIVNCHVRNAVITGGAQKMGLLVGYVNNGSFSPLIIDGNTVEDSEVRSDANPPQGDGTCMTGGLVGYLQAMTYDAMISNNTMRNVNVVSGGIWDEIAECASHVFVGNIINISNSTQIHTIEFANNTIENSSIENVKVQESATDYYGFAYESLQSSYNVLNEVIVDGRVIVAGQIKNQ